MVEIRNIASVLALFGVPSLFALASYFVKACIKFSKKIDILMNAQQKQMRRDLTMDFHRYMAEGHIDCRRSCLPCIRHGFIHQRPVPQDQRRTVHAVK